MQVSSLGWEDPLLEEMATHSSRLALKIPWTEELGGQKSMESQSQARLSAHTHTHTHATAVLYAEHSVGTFNLSVVENYVVLFYLIMFLASISLLRYFSLIFHFLPSFVLLSEK